MQLIKKIHKKSKQRNLSLAEKLAMAATALLGPAVQAQSADEDEWEFVGSILTYSEPDRVTAIEGIFSAEKTFGDSAKLGYKVILDSLTGASANGAITQREVQTFTRPSGNGQYIIDAQDVPLDDTFKDTRGQFNINWTDALTEDSRYTVGSNFSKEYDYLSLSVNGEYAKDFDRKNTTLSIGASFASDTIDPEGGRPLGLSSMVVNTGQFASNDDFKNTFRSTRINGEGSVDTVELLLGWTQIINRRMLMQLNYSYADMSGYLTDPFKVISVIDNNAIAHDYLYEHRPDSRSQHTIYAMTKYHFEDSIVDLSYRYLTDDWDIDSHTIDFKWHVFAGNNTFWEPHIRFYQQSAAEFYSTYLVENQALPQFVSSDYRVGDMDAVTVGLKYGFSTGAGNRIEIRGEYYKQTPNANGAEAVLAAGTLDLYPTVDALAIQVTYYF